MSKIKGHVFRCKISPDHLTRESNPIFFPLIQKSGLQNDDTTSVGYCWGTGHALNFSVMEASGSTFFHLALMFIFNGKENHVSLCLIERKETEETALSRRIRDLHW